MKHPDKRKRLQTQPLPMGKKSRVFLAVYSAAVLCVCCMPVTASAAGDPNAVLAHIFAAVGLILLGWGIVQIGLSFQSHDPSQRSNGFLTLAGGVIVTFAKEILALITG